LKTVAGSSGAVAFGTTALNHEPGDNSVKATVIVKTVTGQKNEVIYGPGGVGGK
jgi:DNA replication protein DnaC